MLRLQVLSAVILLALVVPVGYALAGGPSAGYAGEKVAQVSFIDRKLNLIHLSDGTELRAPDQHMLDRRHTDPETACFIGDRGHPAAGNLRTGDRRPTCPGAHLAADLQLGGRGMGMP